MPKKTKEISVMQFNLMIILISALFFALIYFLAIQERFNVNEGKEVLGGKALLVDGSKLTYKTEYCASRLSDLAHEIHFLEQDIDKQEKDQSAESLKGLKEEVIQIEQRELEMVRKDFDELKSLCDSFDENPTEELCVKFLDDAQDQLDTAKEIFESSKSQGILREVDAYLHPLRKAQRIHNGLSKVCG